MMICVLVFVMSAMICGNVCADEQLADVYKRLADGLIGMRREYPASQPKVYALLDQIDKLYSAAKVVTQKHDGIKKILQERIAENTSLKNELDQLKNDMTLSKKSLELTKDELSKKLAEEKATVEALALERKELLLKISTLEASTKDIEDKIENKKSGNSGRIGDELTIARNNQSFNRTSISEPSSPR